MDPRWNCLGYQSILTGVRKAAAMIVSSKSWLNRATSVVVRITEAFSSSFAFVFVLFVMLRLFPLAASNRCRWEFRLLFPPFCFSFFCLLIDCWCCALIKFDHVSFCIEIWLIPRSLSFRCCALICFLDRFKNIFNNK
jgi:hypothetical protein